VVIFFIVTVWSAPIRRRVLHFLLVFGVDVMHVEFMSILASTSHFWFGKIVYVSIHECEHVGVE